MLNFVVLNPVGLESMVVLVRGSREVRIVNTLKSTIDDRTEP